MQAQILMQGQTDEWTDSNLKGFIDHQIIDAWHTSLAEADLLSKHSSRMASYNIQVLLMPQFNCIVGEKKAVDVKNIEKQIYSWQELHSMTQYLIQEIDPVYQFADHV